ncbi:MAG: ATP-binding cassette domain-containing protein [Wenzhouxiangellaceae bacterium]|nr:ATP-binding cassette domain-containing protein [Wenzhouxiangellaceae bacterium]
MNDSAASGSLKLDRVAVGELEPVSLSVSRGQVVCISGASGSGKTRLLRAVADLEPHAGDCLLGDVRQSETPAHRWRAAVMMVPAESQWWHETVGEHLAADAADASAALDALALPESALEWSISRLSSGEKQRLALIRALLHAPQALLLDEPTANLDSDSVRRVERWLLDIIRRRELPTVWVAHDAEQIRRVSSRHYRIDNKTLREAEAA